MKPETVENLKQFEDASDLLMCVTEKFIENINRFAKKNSKNEIIKCKTPIIVDVLPNKEIIFNKNKYLETVKIDPSIVDAEIGAICQRSVFNFLKRYKKDENETLNTLFNNWVAREK